MTKVKTKNGRPPKRIRGICAAADQLGVTRQHLHGVLTGRRQSKSLKARYHQLTHSN